MNSISCTASARLVPDAAPAPAETAGPRPPRLYGRVAAPPSRKRKRESYGPRGYEMAIDDLATRLASASLDQLSNVNRPYQYRQTLLHAAASAGMPEVAAALLEQGAQLEYADCSGATALHWALRDDNEQTALMLLERGAIAGHVDNAGYTPLILAVRNKCLPVVARLLDGMPAAAVNHLNGEGLSALHAAVLGDQDVLVYMLAQAGAEIDCRAASGLGLTPLMTAALAGRSSMTARLLAMGADPVCSDNVENTALHYAVARGFESIAYQLVCAGAQVNFVNLDGVSSLQLAVSLGSPGMMRLLQHGAVRQQV